MRLIPLSESVVGSVRQSLILLFGAVGLGPPDQLRQRRQSAACPSQRARSRDRGSPGAGSQRTRLIRQLLAESLLLFVLGGIAGFAILFFAQEFLLRLVPESLPHLNDISISWGVLGFALAVSVAAGTDLRACSGMAHEPLDLTETLRQEGRGSKGSRERSRARQILVISELALSLVLMVAAGLLLRSFWDLFEVQPGFNPDRVMAIQTWLPGPTIPVRILIKPRRRKRCLLREILRRSRTLPGVEEAAIGNASRLFPWATARTISTRCRCFAKAWRRRTIRLL